MENFVVDKEAMFKYLSSGFFLEYTLKLGT